VDIKRTHGVLVVGSNENDQGHPLNAEILQDVEPIHVGHLHVQKDDVEFLSVYGINRLSSISGFTNDFYLTIILQQLAYPVTRERLVVYD
jgi:hypothetical protein